jgi:hypothetical protein
MTDEPIRIIDPPIAEGIMLVPQVRPHEQPAEGWMVFAAALIVISALLNLIWGIFAIFHDYYWTGDTLVAGYHSLWGWFYIGIALCLLILVPLIIVRHPVGIFFGTIALALNALFHVFDIGNRPFWSIVGLVLDALAIYALLTHGYRRRPEPIRVSS